MFFNWESSIALFINHVNERWNNINFISNLASTRSVDLFILMHRHFFFYSKLYCQHSLIILNNHQNIMIISLYKNLRHLIYSVNKKNNSRFFVVSQIKCSFPLFIIIFSFPRLKLTDMNVGRSIQSFRWLMVFDFK